jgi:hypothetical protein
MVVIDDVVVVVFVAAAAVVLLLVNTAVTAVRANTLCPLTTGLRVAWHVS